MAANTNPTETTPGLASLGAVATPSGADVRQPLDNGLFTVNVRYLNIRHLAAAPAFSIQ